MSTGILKVKSGNGWITIPAVAGPAGPGLPSGGTAGQVPVKASSTDYDMEWSDNVTDVQVNGTSVVTNGVANVPVAGADANSLGVVWAGGAGISVMTTPGNEGRLAISSASSANVKAGSVTSFPIVPAKQHESTFYGLAKAAGDTSQSASSNAVGTYTDEALVKIQKMLGIYQAPWELIREDTFTNATEANYEITVDSLGQSFELTDVILLFETQKQEIDAACSGEIWLYVNNGGNSTFKAECGAYTQTANSSGHGCGVVARHDSNMFEMYRIGNITTTNTGTVGQRYGANFGIGTNNDRVMYKLATTPITIFKIKIGGVLGNGHYYLYGKRKWTI